MLGNAILFQSVYSAAESRRNSLVGTLKGWILNESVIFTTRLPQHSGFSRERGFGA
jgi:hypothetical protein